MVYAVVVVVVGELAEGVGDGEAMEEGEVTVTRMFDFGENFVQLKNSDRISCTLH